MVALVFIVSISKCVNIDAYTSQYDAQLVKEEQDFSEMRLKRAIARNQKTDLVDKAINKIIESGKNIDIPQSTKDCNGRHYIQLWSGTKNDNYTSMYCFEQVGVDYLGTLNQSDSLFVLNFEFYGNFCDSDTQTSWHYLQVTMDYSLNILSEKCFGKTWNRFPICGNGKRPSDSYSCNELKQIYTTNQKIY